MGVAMKEGGVGLDEAAAGKQHVSIVKYTAVMRKCARKASS